MNSIIIFLSILLGATALLVLTIAIVYIVKLIFGIKMFLRNEKVRKLNDMISELIQSI